jgi:hypothetical protein
MSPKASIRIFGASYMMAALLLTGCGGQSNRQVATQSNTTTSTTDSSSTTSSSSSSTSTSTVTPGIPALSLPVSTTGYNSVTVQVSTRSILRLKFTPGVNHATVNGTGFSPQYTKLGVYIGVGSDTRATALLSNGISGTATSSDVMDFSASFTHNCDTSGNCQAQTVTITVSKPNDDFWCANYGYYCPYAKVGVSGQSGDTSAPWNGTLTVQTDDTNAI